MTITNACLCFSHLIKLNNKINLFSFFQMHVVRTKLNYRIDLMLMIMRQSIRMLHFCTVCVCVCVFTRPLLCRSHSALQELWALLRRSDIKQQICSWLKRRRVYRPLSSSLKRPSLDSADQSAAGMARFNESNFLLSENIVLLNCSFKYTNLINFPPGRQQTLNN